MVKFCIAGTLDAHYEAQLRTAGVSMKPAIGKELFSAAEASGGAFKSPFNTERFIHGDVRRYLLRSSQVRSANADAVKLSASHSNDDSSIYSPLPEADSYRALAARISSSDVSKDIGLHLPIGIRENVIARLLHEAGVRIRVEYNSAGAQLRVGDSDGSITVRGHTSRSDGIRIGKKVAWTEKLKVLSSSASNWNIVHKMSDSSPTVVDYIDVSTTFSNRKADGMYIGVHGGRSGLCLKAGTEVGKMVFAASSEASLCGSAGCVNLSEAGGFGTAPIWYQQSMATGPPPKCILAVLYAIC